MANPNPTKRKSYRERNRKFLLGRLQDMYGEDFNPVMRMAENAVQMQEMASSLPEADITQKGQKFQALRQTLEAWGKIAEYTNGKAKQSELSDEPDPTLEPITIGLRAVKAIGSDG